MEAPNETGEHLNGPGVAEHVLDVRDVHTELVAESLLHIEGDFAQDAMDFGNSLIGHSDLRKVGILEESVVRLFFLDTEGDSPVHVGLVAARLWEWDLTTGEHFDVTTIFELNGALDILRSGNVLNFDTGRLVLFTLDRDVDIDTELAVLDLSVRDAEGLEEFLELADDQLGVVRVSGLLVGDNLEKGHASSVVVNQHFVALVDGLGCVLLHLDAFNEDVVLVLLVVVEEETAVEHDGVVLLSDLVRLRKVSVHIVLSVELDLGQDAATEGK